MKIRLCVLTAIAMLFLGTAAAQSGWPARQAGLWEIDVAVGSAAPVRVRQCTSPEVDQVTFLSIVPSQENCRRTVRQPTKNVWKISAVCRVHGAKAVSEIRIQGDLKRSYLGVYSILKPGQTQRETGSFKARHVGACADGMKAGEMELPNHVKVDTRDIGQPHREHQRAPNRGSDGRRGSAAQGHQH